MLGTRSWGLVGGGGWNGGWVLVLGWVSLNDDYTARCVKRGQCMCHSTTWTFGEENVLLFRYAIPPSTL